MVYLEVPVEGGSGCWSRSRLRSCRVTRHPPHRAGQHPPPGPSPDLDTALDHGNRAVDVLARVASARVTDYARDLLNRLQPWQPGPSVADLTHRIRTELAAA